MDSFKNIPLYPQNDKSFLEHFEGVFDSVYIGFLPFFTINDRNFNNFDYKKAVEVTLEQARMQDDIFNNIEASNATIHIRNVSYPSDEEILAHGKIVPWFDVLNSAGLASKSDLYKALKTSIGAYNENYARPDLAKKLDRFTRTAQVWQPGEGHYDVLTLVKIYNSFRLLGITHIIVEDEFLETRKELILDNITHEKFIEEISGKDYYIYSADQSILFSIDWDSFFFIICSSSSKIARIIEQEEFDGFFASSITTHTWEDN